MILCYCYGAKHRKKHTHAHTDSDEYSIVAFCKKKPTIITNKCCGDMISCNHQANSSEKLAVYGIKTRQVNAQPTYKNIRCSTADRLPLRI